MRTRWLLGMLAVAMVAAMAVPAMAAPKYRMTKWGWLNGSDYYSGANSSNGSFSSNPFSWRHGYWGGAKWTNGQNIYSNNWNGNVTAPTVDALDGKFKLHDKDYRAAHANFWWLPPVEKALKQTADTLLLSRLNSLPNICHFRWGSIYVPSSDPENAPDAVAVHSSTAGLLRYGPQASYSGSKSMPYSEYARRQAKVAFVAKLFF